MAVCLSCMNWCHGPVCRFCIARLEQAGSVILPGGVEVFSAFAHNGVARQLIHRLKYDGIAAAGVVLADALAPCVPDWARALVPVPRSVVRRIRYGADPALTLARLLAQRTGLPVAGALRPPIWWPAHAGSGRDGRSTPRFTTSGPVPIGAVLVDDVLTTGATIDGAARVSGILAAVTATRAGREAAG